MKLIVRASSHLACGSAVVRRKYSEDTCIERSFLDASFKNLDCIIRTGKDVRLRSAFLLLAVLFCVAGLSAVETSGGNGTFTRT